MTSLDLIASFASAARHASFAKAARELGLSPSAVAKNVARLESQLGVRLFHRTTRQVTMSQDGEDLYTRCQRILEEVESLEAAVADARTGPRGTLRIDMPVTYGRQVVLPVLTKLMARYPRVEDRCPFFRSSSRHRQGGARCGGSHRAACRLEPRRAHVRSAGHLDLRESRLPRESPQARISRRTVQAYLPVVSSSLERPGPAVAVSAR